MPFTLTSSGDKNFVKSQVSGQITGSYDQAPKGKDRDDIKSRMEKIRDFIFDDLGADFPDNSPMGLILIGDAGKDYISITRLELSLSKPAKEADEENNPALDKGPVEPEKMNPPAPDKKSVGEGSSKGVEQPAGTETNPTTASPNFTGTSPLNPTTTGKF